MLVTYGYGALFFGTLVEGETFLLSAAVLAALNYLDWTLVIGAAFAGAYLGDQVFFQLGRAGRALPVTSPPGWQGRLAVARRLLQRHRLKLILGYRFLYGLRAVIPFAIGTSGCRVLPFMGLSALSALAWVLVNCAAGRLMGGLWETSPVGMACGLLVAAGCAAGLVIFRCRR